MTKNEFKLEVSKTDIPSELYGAVLSGQLYSTCGPVSGGKVVGIEWYDEWQTRTEYNCWIGSHEVTSLGKAPYIVLMKDRKKYLVESWKVMQYINKIFKEWLNEKVKNKEIL